MIRAIRESIKIETICNNESFDILYVTKTYQVCIITTRQSTKVPN